MIKIDELDEIKDELQDKFGKFPVIVERLILTAILRFYVSFSQFERIVITRKKITLILPKGDKEEFYRDRFSILMQLIVAEYSKTIKFVQDKDVMKLESENNFNTPEEVLNSVISFFKKLILVFKMDIF